GRRGTRCAPTVVRLRAPRLAAVAAALHRAPAPPAAGAQVEEEPAAAQAGAEPDAAQLGGGEQQLCGGGGEPLHRIGEGIARGGALPGIAVAGGDNLAALGEAAK